MNSSVRKRRTGGDRGSPGKGFSGTGFSQPRSDARNYSAMDEVPLRANQPELIIDQQINQN